LSTALVVLAFKPIDLARAGIISHAHMRRMAKLAVVVLLRNAISSIDSGVVQRQVFI
jgi:hypothetical protein